jgi:2-oxoglutarate ferredoxin oxidoreductase subunit beta
LLHALRRNVDLKILMFNNQIYGLTKGQYSPTSPAGKRAKSTPMGSVDFPLDPVSIALAANASFVARSADVNVKHLQTVLAAAAAHKGSVFVEILQNCPIFNDGAFAHVTDRTTKAENTLEFEHGKPLTFSSGKGIALNKKLKPEILTYVSETDERLLVHDEESETHAQLLSRLRFPEFPVPLGIFKRETRPSYDQLVNDQVREARDAKKHPQASDKRHDLQSLLNAGSWTVEA